MNVPRSCLKVAILALACIVTFACKKPVAPIVSKIEVSTIFEYSERTNAYVGGIVKTNGVEKIIERGICWDTVTNPTIKSKVLTSPGDTGKYSIMITGLVSGREFHAKAFARTATQTSYGNQISFTTKKAPTIATEAVTNINYQSCTISGRIDGESSEPVLQKGVCWNTGGNPTLSDAKTDHGPGDGPFASTLDNLRFGTKYYFRIYATTSFGTEYGTETSFTTSSVVLPSIVTSAITEVTTQSAISGGVISSDGGAPILRRGVCWNFVGNPIPDISSPYQTNDGSGTGKFTSSMHALYPFSSYGIRAYATNVAGTAYGQLETFTTLAASMPGPPLLTPSNNALIKCCSANFSWGANPFAEYYTLQVSKSALFDGQLISSNISCSESSTITSSSLLSTILYGTTYCLKMDNSTLDGTWYWRVRFFGAGAFSAWSAPRSFIFEK